MLSYVYWEFLDSFYVTFLMCNKKLKLIIYHVYKRKTIIETRFFYIQYIKKQRKKNKKTVYFRTTVNRRTFVGKVGRTNEVCV